MPLIADNTGQANPASDNQRINDQRWAALWAFLLYRLILIGGLYLLFVTHAGPGYLGRSAPSLFANTAIFYFALILAQSLLLLRRVPGRETQAYIMLFIDIAACTLLMHSSGGVTSGLGILLAVSIAIGTLLISGRTALLLASLGSLAVITEQIYTYIALGAKAVSFTQAGLLGTLLFAIALLAFRLSGQLRASEKLVSQKELDLANMAQLNEYIIQHMKTGVIVLDNNHKIRLMNDTAWYLLGLPAAGAGDILETASPELYDLFQQWNENAKLEIDPFKATSSGGELKPVFASLGKDTLTGTLIFLDDTSKLTARAQQMKLASLGRLTASIAHEIRNPLGAIGHASQLLNESPDLIDGDKRLTEIIRSNTGRVNTIIENVLQISRRSKSHPINLNLKPWVEDFILECERNKTLPSGIVQINIEPETTEVCIDPSQLHQVLSNLCDNALTHGGGSQNLRVRIIGGITPESKGPFLDIIDNGPGITPNEAKQIFEPFFTTGTNGTGLGLYMAKELCEMNRGHLEYIPIPTGGSCFRIRFAPPSRTAA